jgi:uncharacterized membrane protein
MPEAIPYLIVFIAAAAPWLEILLVIPAAIAMGLAPVPAAAVAFIGNILPVYGIVYLYDLLEKWWQKRKRANQLNEVPETASGEELANSSKRKERAKKIMADYGVPGLALAGPLLTGVHLAALVALGLGAQKNAVSIWMTISLLIWTVVVTAASVYGLEQLTWLI